MVVVVKLEEVGYLFLKFFFWGFRFSLVGWDFIFRVFVVGIFGNGFFVLRIRGVKSV